MSMLRKPSGAAASTPAEAIALDDCSSSHPAVVEFLSLACWDDGSPRKPGTVKLFFDQGHFKAFINCNDSSRYACVSADSLGGLLDTIEAVLVDDSVEWRKSNYGGNGRQKKGS